MILAIVVPDATVLRRARAPFLLAEVIDEGVRDRSIRVCVGVGGVRVRSDVAVAVFVTRVGVQVVCIAVRAETRECDDHDDEADADDE